jgi:hypothetical protein
MAKFRGVFPPTELITSPCGILSVANTTVHTGREYDERWIRGIDYEFDTMPSYVTIRQKLAILNTSRSTLTLKTLHQPLA